MGTPGRTDRATLEVPASPDTVFAAFAEPDKLIAWLPPGGMTGRALAYDLRPGGRYRFALTYGASAPAGAGKTADRTDISAGNFLSLEPGRSSVQSVQFESADAAVAGEMTISWSFQPTAAGTRVTATADIVPAGIS